MVDMLKLNVGNSSVTVLLTRSWLWERLAVKLNGVPAHVLPYAILERRELEVRLFRLYPSVAGLFLKNPGVPALTDALKVVPG